MSHCIRIVASLVCAAVSVTVGGCKCSSDPVVAAVDPDKAGKASGSPKLAVQSAGAAAKSASHSSEIAPSLAGPYALGDRAYLPPLKWPKRGVDVLVRVSLPLLEPAEVDQRLRPLTASLKADPQVDHAWRHASLAHGRLLIRFSAKTPATVAEELVRKALVAAGLSSHGGWAIASIARGARTVAGISLDAKGGRIAAARQPWQGTVKKLATMDDVTGVGGFGLVDDFIVLGLDPAAMMNLGVVFADAEAAIALMADKMRASPAASGTTTPWTAARLKELMAKTPVARRLADASAQNAYVADIVVVEGGQGDPGGCDALVGRQSVTVATAVGGLRSDQLHMSIAKMASHDLAAVLGANVRPFHHHLRAAERFVLELDANSETETHRALADRLGALARATGVIDILALEGIDGVPRRLSPETPRGRVWTLWLSLDQPGKSEALLTLVRTTLRPGGWHVRALPQDYDTGLGWLLGVWATTGAVIIADDPGQLGPPIRTLAAMSETNVAITDRRSGPRREAPNTPYALLQRQAAIKANVPPKEIVSIVELLASPRFLVELPLTAKGPATRVFLGFAAGVLRRNIGRLPVAKAATWGDLQQLADTVPRIDQISRDGRPVLWFAQDALSVRADDLARDFWRTAEGQIGTTRARVVQSLRLTDDAFEVR